MAIAELILEYLKAVLAAPVITGSVAVFFLFKYDRAIRGLISRIASIRLPGGSELVTPQLPPDPKKEDVPLPIPDDEHQPLLPAALTDAQLRAIKELFAAERVRSYLWEYRYLNLFLAPITQGVLEWFSTLSQRVSTVAADALWSSRIPDASQREIILQVLESHHLVQRDRELLGITPKGREYMEWKSRI